MASRKKVKSPTGRPSKLSSAGKKLLSGNYSGGTRPKKPVVKKKPVKRERLRSLKDLQMDRIIAGKSRKK